MNLTANKTIISIEVKREQSKYYAELYYQQQAIARSGLFHTAAGASIAGNILANRKRQQSSLL